MDPRFRGDDGVFFRYRQIIRHSRVGKLFVIPGRRSRTRNPWGSSLRCGLKPMDPRFRGDDGGAVHGVRRLSTDPTPWIPAFAGMTTLRYWGSSLRHGLNPMDPRLAVPRNFFSLRETRLAVPRNFFSLRETRFRGNDGLIQSFPRARRHGSTRT